MAELRKAINFLEAVIDYGTKGLDNEEASNAEKDIQQAIHIIHEAITAWNTRHHNLAESNYLKVLFDGSKTHDSGCIVWQKRCSNRGYGEISYLGNKSLTHRVMYELINGPVPEGKCVCHTCDNPSCINPKHLFLGTQSDNMKDCVKKGRCYNPKGEEHVSAKLTEEQARKIKSSPLLTSILAKDYGVSVGTIRSIKRGTTWKHLSRPENPLLEELKRYKDAIKAIEKYTRPNEGEEIDNIDRIATFCNWATKQIEGKMVITTCGPVIITDEKDRTQAIIAEAKEQIK